ncbi:MAG: hypothetical protein AAGH38_11020 [Pseudomonadota bacterium]
MSWLKYLLPYDKFTLDVPHPPHEVIEELSVHVEPPGIFGTFFGWRLDSLFSNQPRAKYLGHVRDRRFKICSQLLIRNGFLSMHDGFMPTISGRVEPRFEGSRIFVHQRPNIFILMVTLLWLSAAAFVFVEGAEDVLHEGPQVLDGDDQFFVSGLFLFAVGVILTNGGFWWEARHTKPELELMFSAS